MDTKRETQALDGPTRIAIVGRRAIICQPGALDEEGRVVRPDLMPLWLQRPNRAARRARQFKHGRRGGG